MSDEVEGDVSEYLVHPAFKPRLDAWLATQGMEAVRMPFLDGEDPDAIPIYNIQPTQETWELWRRRGT
jgi:hypothetical protein